MYVPITALRFDYIAQSFLIGLNVLLSFALLANVQYFILLLLYQLLLGGVQFMSALLHYFRPNLSPDIKAMRSWHLAVSVGLLAVLAFCILTDAPRYGSDLLGNIGANVFFWAVILVVPQFLAYSYYLLTRTDYLSRKKYIDSRHLV